MSDWKQKTPQIREHLATVSLRDLIDKGYSQPEVFTLQHDMTVAEALKALSKRKILSAPLMVSASLEDLDVTEIPPEPSLLGWVDVKDILRGLLAHLHEKHKNLPTNMLHLMTDLEAEGKPFGQKMLVTLAGGEDRSLLYQADDSNKLLDTVKDSFLQVHNNNRVVHRLAIFDSHGTITNIFSHLDVIKYLTDNAPLIFGEMGGVSVEALGLVNHRHMITVQPTTSTILAFESMIRAGVSAAAVITDKGEMIANLSISDIRAIQPEHLGVLALPVAEFLALLHQTAYLGYSQRSSETDQKYPFFAGSSPKVHASIVVPDSPGHPCPMPPPGLPGSDTNVRLIAVKPTSTLREVLMLLSENHVHRVYIMDPDKKPQVVGVITPTDILGWIMS